MASSPNLKLLITEVILEHFNREDTPIPADLLYEFLRITMSTKSDDECSSTTAGMSPGPATPTYSTSFFDDKDSLHAVETSQGIVPWQGNDLVIRERGSGKVITMGIDGVQLKKIGPMGGWHWKCVEHDGWLGFRNVVSGRYLGHNNKGGFHALQTHHKGWESFVAKANPYGGYELLTIHGWKFMKMRVAKDGLTLEETDGKGALWDFVKYPVTG